MVERQASARMEISQNCLLVKLHFIDNFSNPLDLKLLEGFANNLCELSLLVLDAAKVPVDINVGETPRTRSMDLRRRLVRLSQQYLRLMSQIQSAPLGSSS